MKGKGERTAVSGRRRPVVIHGTPRSGALSWACTTVALVGFIASLLVGGPAVVIVVVAVLAALTVALAWRAPHADHGTERPVDGPGRLHAEVERARRLEYSFALVRLDRTAVPAGPEETVRSELRIKSMLRATDVLIDSAQQLYLLLPASRPDELGAVWSRLSEVMPDESALWQQRSIAVFPDDAVTGEGLLEVCRQGTGSVDNRAAANGRAPGEAIPDLRPVDGSATSNGGAVEGGAGHTANGNGRVNGNGNGSGIVVETVTDEAGVNEGTEAGEAVR